MTRKWLAMILALAMLLTMLPIAGLAEDVIEDSLIEEIVESPAEAEPIEEPIEEPAEEPAQPEEEPAEQPAEQPIEAPAEDEVIESDGTVIVEVDKTYLELAKKAEGIFKFDIPGKTGIYKLTTSVSDANGLVTAFKTAYGNSAASGTVSDDGAKLDGNISDYCTTNGGAKDVTFTAENVSVDKVTKYTLTYYSYTTDSSAELVLGSKQSLDFTVKVTTADLPSTALAIALTNDLNGASDKYGYVGLSNEITATATGTMTSAITWEVVGDTSAITWEVSKTTATSSTIKVTGVKATDNLIYVRAYALDKDSKKVASDAVEFTIKTTDEYVPVSVEIKPSESTISAGKSKLIEATVNGKMPPFDDIAEMDDSGLAVLDWTINGVKLSDWDNTKQLSITNVDGSSHALSVTGISAGDYILTATTKNGISALAAITVTTGVASDVRVAAGASPMNVIAGQSMPLTQYLEFLLADGTVDTTNKVSHDVTWKLNDSGYNTADKKYVTLVGDTIALTSDAVTGTFSVTATLVADISKSAIITFNVVRKASDNTVRSMMVYTGAQPYAAKGSTTNITAGAVATSSDKTQPDMTPGTTIVRGYKLDGTLDANFTAASSGYLETLVVGNTKIRVNESKDFNILYSTASNHVIDDAGNYALFNTAGYSFNELAAGLAQPNTTWNIVAGTTEANATWASALTPTQIAEYATVDSNGTVTIHKEFGPNPTDVDNRYLMLQAVNNSNSLMYCYTRIYSGYATTPPTMEPSTELTGATTDLAQTSGIVTVIAGEELTGNIIPEPANATNVKYTFKNLNESLPYATGDLDVTGKPAFTIVAMNPGMQVFKYTAEQDNNGDDKADITFSGYIRVKVVAETPVTPTPIPDFDFGFLQDSIEIDLASGDTGKLDLDGDVTDWNEVSWTNDDEFINYFVIDDGEIFATAVTPANGVVARASVTRNGVTKTASVTVIITDGAPIVTDEPTETPTAPVVTETPTAPVVTATPTAPVVTEEPTDEPTDEPTIQTGYVSGSSVNLRERPSSGSDRIAKMPKGTLVEILGADDGWYHVNTIYGEGYVSGTYVTGRGNGDYSTAGYVVTASSLNIRTDASTSAPKLDISPLARGVYVTVLDINNAGTWAYVDYMGNEGWVSINYIDEI